MKIIKRLWFNSGATKEEIENGCWGYFIEYGIWADGRKAYSMVDEKGNEIEGEEGAYAQIRIGHKLRMVRV